MSDVEMNLGDRAQVLFLGRQKVEKQRGEAVLVQECRDLPVTRAEAARSAAVREENDAKRVLRDAKVGLQFHAIGGDAHSVLRYQAHAPWTEPSVARSSSQPWPLCRKLSSGFLRHIPAQPLPRRVDDRTKNAAQGQGYFARGGGLPAPRAHPFRAPPDDPAQRRRGEARSRAPPASHGDPGRTV